jgi:hypothetical protein
MVGAGSAPAPRAATIGRVTANGFRGGEIMGIRISTLIEENNAIRCAGCGEPISGTPFRVSIMDAVSREAPPSWATRAALNPGPHEFHADPSHFRVWARRRGYFFCRLSEVRELMRPVPLPGEEPRFGLCDGNHRESHEFVPA